jgi:Ser/Thr protein kinase RdoA (MazF antagonist)
MNHAAEWTEHWRSGHRDQAALARFATIGPSEIARRLWQSGLPYLNEGSAIHGLENRVFRFEQRDFGVVYAKLYRPGSWGLPAICEELAFLEEIQSEGIPAVRPLLPSPVELDGLWVCPFEGISGENRTNAPLPSREVELLGQLTAKLHLVAGRKRARERRSMHPIDYAAGGASFLAECEFVRQPVREQICELAGELVAGLEESRFRLVERLHGDLGLWNILWTEYGPVPIDFADMGPGPAVHDLAQVALGIGGFTSPPMDLTERRRILETLSDGYGLDEMGRGQVHQQVALILAARRIHVNAWIASRWQDRRFQSKYPEFTDETRWRRELSWIRAELEESQSL